MSHTENEPEFIEADPAARRKAVVIVALTIVFGGLVVFLILALEGPLQDWLEDNIELLVSRPWIVLIASLILVSPILWGGCYLFKYGSTVVRHQQLPAPGYGIVRRMSVQRGREAVFKGRLVQAVSAFIILCATMIPAFLTALFVLLGNME
ncbi:MAG: hypothetical protein MI746_15205 [Pseudomonadales bacterium]|nr:hypothetical protein [Pseudomonadales bacterium]